MNDPSDDEPDYDEFEFEFELLNSEDGLTVTLVCRSDKPLSPDEFAEALRSFADRIDILGSIGDASSGATVN